MSLYATRENRGESVLLDERKAGKDIARIVSKECAISRVRVGGTVFNLGNNEMSVSYLCNCSGKKFVACVEYSLIPTEDVDVNLPVINSLSVSQADKPCFGVSGYKRFERYARRLGLDVEFSEPKAK